MWYAILGIGLLATSILSACNQGERLLQNGHLAILIWGCGVAGSALATFGAPRVHRTWILFAAFGLRALTFCGTPFLSDDVFRYVHEGRATRIGIEVPYTIPPRDIVPPPDDGISGRVNHPEIPAVYPPFSQGLLWASVAIGDVIEKPLPTLRAVWLLFDAWLLLWFWRCRRRRPLAFGFYAFHVLPILEVGMELHLDIVGATLCFAGWLFRFRASLAGVFWGLAAGVKPVAVLGLVSLSGTPRRLRRALLFCVLAIGATCAPYVLNDVSLSSGLRSYGTRWQANPTAYALFEKSVEAPFLRQQNEGKWLHLHIAHTPAGLWLEEGHKTVLALGDARPVQDPWLIDQRLTARFCCAVLFLLLTVWLSQKIRKSGLKVLGAFLAFWLLTPTLYPWYLLWVMPFGAWFRSMTIWFGCASAPLLHQAAFTRANEGIWEEALWPRVIFLLALGLGGFLDWRRWKKIRCDAPAPSATAPPDQKLKD